jgi:hypothetical protein
VRAKVVEVHSRRGKHNEEDAEEGRTVGSCGGGHGSRAASNLIAAWAMWQKRRQVNQR